LVEASGIITTSMDVDGGPDDPCGYSLLITANEDIRIQYMTNES
jgi:hypothetical protein